ncbi:putative nuclease HARBI1 isoform X2 [Onthophagus taurus]|uniref:putative nuclease HARBI1 isoform X2 n=1 Tax=Onthophagus taurus TaxID=166361 RepID=UPI0039BDD791
MDFERESSSDEEMIEDLEEIKELFPIRGGRVMKERIDHVHHLSDAEFVKRFRLSKECFHRLLSEVEENIKPRTERNSAIFASNRLLLTLRFFATGNMLLAVADFCGVSEAAASQIVKLVAIAIANLRPQYCKMPEGDDIGKAQRSFYNIARFPLVIGTIDCTHVRIQSPGGDQAENFRNRKGYFSFNVQTVSDANLKILDIVARWPGSTHDQTIFNNSSIRNRFEQGHFGNGILLGDSGYRNTNYLLTPLVAPRTEAERLYNEAQIRTRNVVERQYGVWKRRFQVLRLEMRVATERDCGQWNLICHRDDTMNDIIRDEEMRVGNFVFKTLKELAVTP